MVDQDRDYLSKAPDEKPQEDQPQWRRDFPVDVPEDNYISRREFTKFLVLTSAAFTVGQFWIVWENLRRKERDKPAAQKVASLKDIPVGRSLVFYYPTHSEPCLLMRPDESTLLAYSQKCTHLACAVIPDMQNNRIECPCHHGYFALEDGRVLAGPPPRPLPKIHVELRGEDIYATGIELRTA